MVGTFRATGCSCSEFVFFLLRLIQTVNNVAPNFSKICKTKKMQLVSTMLIFFISVHFSFKSKTNFGKKIFRFTAANHWNILPIE